MPVSTRHPHAEVVIPAARLDNRAAWLAARQTGITATDGRVLAGHPYADESVFSHWQDKFTDPDEAPRVVPLRWRIGSFMEDGLAMFASEALGVEVAKVGMLRSTIQPFMLSSPDRNCSCGGHVELKVTDRYQLARHKDQPGEVNLDGWTLPPGWRAQGCHQVATSGRDHVHFAALLGRDDITTWTVTYTEDEMSMASMRALLLWEHVVAKTPPPIDWDTVTVAEMKARYPAVVVDRRVLTDQEYAEFTADLLIRQHLKADAKELDAEVDEVENRIRHTIGDAEELWHPSSTKPLIRYPSVVRGTFQPKLLADAHPEIDLAPFVKYSSSRRFTSVAKV